MATAQRSPDFVVTILQPIESESDCCVCMVLTTRPLHCHAATHAEVYMCSLCAQRLCDAPCVICRAEPPQETLRSWPSAVVHTVAMLAAACAIGGLMGLMIEFLDIVPTVLLCAVLVITTITVTYQRRRRRWR